MEPGRRTRGVKKDGQFASENQHNEPSTHNRQEGSLFEPLLPRRTFKDIEKQIRTLIYSGHLKPGDRLPSEKELAVQVGAGRLSVREALRMLEQAGLIVVRQGVTGGSYINKLDEKVTVNSMIDLMWQGDIQVEDVTEARSSIEKLILEKAFNRLTEEKLLALQSSVEGLEALVAEERQKEYPVDPTLTEFHMLLAEATNNPVFPIILKVLTQVTLRVMTPAHANLERLRKHASSHRSVLNALKKGDLEGAVRSMEEHMVQIGNKHPVKAGGRRGGHPHPLEASLGDKAGNGNAEKSKE